MEYLHLFKTKTEHDSFYGGNKYKEPWLAYIRDNTLVTGNNIYRNEYLTLSALDDGTITITIPSGINSTYATSLSYSKDKLNWIETIIDNTEQTIEISVSRGNKVYLKGDAVQWFEWDAEKGMNITSSADMNASGNAMSLLYDDDFKDKTTFPDESQCVFGDLFNSNEHLINAENLILPAITLVSDCYWSMFRDCTALTTAPKLPATTLASYCYGDMFKGCALLTKAPELPVTTLVEGCYFEMFYECRQLNIITMLANDISAFDCLFDWVNGVAATGTFTKSLSMTTLPIGSSGIPSGWEVVDYSDYLTLSALGDGEITITIPSNIGSWYATSLSYSKDKYNWVDTVIDNTTQTIRIPVYSGDKVYLKGEAQQWGDGREEAGMFINSSADINASGNIMSLLYGDDFKDKMTIPSETDGVFYELFRNNAHLINAKNLILPANTLASQCYYGMFHGCSSLETAPALPATTLGWLCYYQMFQNCTSLATAPELPATTLTQGCYNSMFYGCSSLTTAPALPATTLTRTCYYQMFCKCSSLTTAPDLPATTLAWGCYSVMFYGCSKLNSITMLATNISATDCLSNWVWGVAAKGTFTKASSASIPSGASGIPSGWTVMNK